MGNRSLADRTIQILSYFKNNFISHRALRKGRSGRRILLIGTPNHGNLGDHAIAMASMQLLQSAFPDTPILDITMPAWLVMNDKNKSYIDKNDILVVCGGGWFGTLWPDNELTVRNIVASYPNNQLVIFPQTVYYEDDESGRKELEKARDIYSNHAHLLFCLREKASYDFVLEHGLAGRLENCLLAPDMVLYCGYPIPAVTREGVLLCFRKDREKILRDEDIDRIRQTLDAMGIAYGSSSTHLHRTVRPRKRKQAVLSKLAEFSRARLIITDRLHVMLFAAITGTPCMAFDNLSGKVHGVYEWIKELDYIYTAKTLDAAIANIRPLIELSNRSYNPEMLREYYEKITTRMGK